MPPKMINVLSRKESLQLIFQEGMLHHILAHSLQVCRVALLLSFHLNREKPVLNSGLTEAGSLLHDITKTRSLDSGENHAETGGQLLTELGYPEIGDLIRQHVRLDDFSPDTPLTEAEIVNYADKRVLHDRIAGLEERMGYIMQRYGSSPELRIRLTQVWEEARQQEIKIFRDIPFAPEDMLSHLPSPGCEAEMEEYRIICDSFR